MYIYCMQNTHTHSQYICINMEPRSVHPHTHNIYKHATLCCTHKHTIHIETRNLVLYTNTHTLYRNTEPRVAYPCGRDPDDEWGKSWAEIMQYRFTSQGEMDNHAVGNLLLTALWDRDTDPVKGLDRVGQLLKVVGRVLPMALEPLDIEGSFVTKKGVQIVRGQVEVSQAIGKVNELILIPNQPKPTPEALTALENADWITIGPGSWLSSVMPHFLLAECRLPLFVDAHP